MFCWNVSNLSCLRQTRQCISGLDAGISGQTVFQESGLREPPLVHPAAIAQVMVNFATRFGVDAQACLLGTGVELDDLTRPDTWLLRSQEMRLLENMIMSLPDRPALGFELGLQYNVSTFGIWGFAIRTSPTLAAAVGTALRYLPLSTAYCRFSVIHTDTSFGIAADPAGIAPQLRDFLLERDMGTAFNLVRELGLNGVPVQQLEFQNLPATHLQRIEELTGIRPVTGCRNNAILLDRRHAESQLPTCDLHLLRVFEDQCARQLRQRQVEGLTGQVRQILLGSGGLVLTLEEVAQSLSVSPRSLRRRLAEEGVNFRDLLEAERKQLAAQLLSTQMKLDEMALHLGYGDTASFTRAFRRWYQCSPGEYRRTGSH
jgi:AraC-like DNA-binding protein